MESFDGVMPAGLSEGHKEPVQMIPLKLCPAGSRPCPASSKVVKKLASIMHVGQTRMLMAQVDADRGILLCYTCPTDGWRQRRSSRERGLSAELQVVLRVPLFLASVARLGDTLVSITPAAQEALERARGISSPCQPVSALKWQEGAETPESWTFECQSADWADVLMDSLQTAGCILQGLGQRYQLFDPVAEGSFGVVFRAGSRSSGAQVAVKLFTKDYDGSTGLVHPLMEFGILHLCSHPNILRSQGLFEVTEKETLDCAGVQGGRTFAIVTEYLNGGTLLDEVRASGRARPLGEERTHTVMKQLLQAVAALHDAGIVHRDIKPDNIVLSGAGRDCIKLIDFGLAAREADEEAMRMKSGSPGYAAPEVCKEPLSYKADCFSCGVTMFILLTGKTPFPGRDPAEVLFRNMRCRIDEQALSAVSSSARDLVMGLLQKRPRNRLSAEEALAHPWFSQKGVVGAGPRRLPGLLMRKAVGDPPLRSDCAKLAQTVPRASGASAARALRERAETAHGHVLRSSRPSSSRRTCPGFFGGESPAEQSTSDRVEPLDFINYAELVSRNGKPASGILERASFELHIGAGRREGDEVDQPISIQ